MPRIFMTGCLAVALILAFAPPSIAQSGTGGERWKAPSLNSKRETTTGRDVEYRKYHPVTLISAPLAERRATRADPRPNPSMTLRCPPFKTRGDCGCARRDCARLPKQRRKLIKREPDDRFGSNSEVTFAFGHVRFATGFGNPCPDALRPCPTRSLVRSRYGI